MNILVVVDRTWPCDHAFIEEVYAKRLRSFGHRVTVMMSQRNRRDALVRTWHDSILLTLGSRSSWVSRVQLMYGTAVLVGDRDYDVVVVRNRPLSALAGNCASDTPIVYQLSHFKEETVSYLTRVREDNWYSGSIRRIVARLGVSLRQLALSAAELVLPVSEAMMDALQEKGLSKQKMAVVGLGADHVDIDTREVRKVRASYCPDADTAMLLYVGTLTRGRHLEVLVEAVRKLQRTRQVSLLFVGEDATGDGDKYLEKYAEDRGLTDSISVVGPVPRTEVPVYIDAADVGLSHFPDHWLFEMNSPIKVMEYLAQGLPVVCSQQPEQACLVKGCEAGVVVQAGSPDEYASAISRVLDRTWDRSRISERFLNCRSYDKLAATLDKHLSKVKDMVK